MTVVFQFVAQWLYASFAMFWAVLMDARLHEIRSTTLFLAATEEAALSAVEKPESVVIVTEIAEDAGKLAARAKPQG